MKTLEFLRNGGMLEQLEEKFAIKSKRHKDYPQLVLLKYDQINSPMSEEIAMQCRGLILDESDNYKVISRSFDRFFNHGEGNAAPVNWETARVYDKVDGSLAVIYCYDGKWHVQTSGTPDASGEVQGPDWDGSMTFKDLFWKTWNDLGYELPPVLEKDEPGHSYIFELCTKYNKVVVQHKEPKIIYLGERSHCEKVDCCNFQQYPPEDMSYNGRGVYGWEIVRSFPMTSFEQVVEACRQINPIENEGFVICDANFNRVKVKSPQYVALNNIRDGHGPKRIMEIIRTNESAEFLTYFPEWKDEYTKYSTQYNNLINLLEETYRIHKDIESQKGFAMAIQNIPFSGALFQLRRKTVSSVKEYLSKINVDNLVEYVSKQ